MRHPDLQCAFHQSLLDAYPKTSILSIAPSGDVYQAACRLAVFVQLKLKEMEFYRRLSDRGDDEASRRLYNVMELDSIVNWLSSRVKSIDLLKSEKRQGVPTLSKA